MEFKWDEKKAAANLADHGVSFDEAKTVFDDPLYERGESVRLISAREVTLSERKA